MAISFLAACEYPHTTGANQSPPDAIPQDEYRFLLDSNANPEFSSFLVQNHNILSISYILYR